MPSYYAPRLIPSAGETPTQKPPLTDRCASSERRLNAGYTDEAGFIDQPNLYALNSAGGPIAAPPGNRLEALKSDRKGQFSVRINDQYRLCFRWTNEGPTDVEIVDY